VYRFDEADRSAPSLSASIRWAALLRLSRTRDPPFPASPGRRGRGPMGIHALCPRSTPTAGGACNARLPGHAEVTPSSPVPLDRPRRRIGRWPCALSLRRGGYRIRPVLRVGISLVEKVQGVEIVGVCWLNAEHNPFPPPRGEGGPGSARVGWGAAESAVRPTPCTDPPPDPLRGPPSPQGGGKTAQTQAFNQTTPPASSSSPSSLPCCRPAASPAAGSPTAGSPACRPRRAPATR